MFPGSPSSPSTICATRAAVALLVAIAFFSTSCKSDYPPSGKAASPDSKTQPRQVRTAKVSEMPIGETVTVNGTLAAYDRVTVSMKVPGRLQTITVDLGSVVHKAQSVARLEQQDYKLRVQQNETALAQARARLGLSPDGADDHISAEQTGPLRQTKALLDHPNLKPNPPANLAHPPSH